MKARDVVTVMVVLAILGVCALILWWGYAMLTAPRM